MRAIARSLMVLACLAAPACGGAPAEPKAPAAPPGPPIALEPFHLTATESEGDLTVDAYDAAMLFDRAADKLRQGRCDEAIAIYERLVAEFPTSTLAEPSLYNRGLCAAQIGRHQDAIASFGRLVELFPDSRDLRDAMFQIVRGYEEMESWENVLATCDSLLDGHIALEGTERVEALARKGAALVELDRRVEARAALNEAVALFRVGQGIPPSASTFHAAMARFKLGEILEKEMREVVLPSEEVLVQASLERKCELLLDAQGEYSRAIKLGHPHWAAAAAYRIGNLYRSLWDDMLAAPPPQDLDTDSQKIYAEVLRGKIRILLVKAVAQWERTLKMARRLNLSNEWVEQTARDLNEIRVVMALVETQAADAGE